MRKTDYLSNINTPKDLRRLPISAMPALAEEIRSFLVEHVGVSGGHLASNLGVVELTIALHRVFRTPHDRIIFDVGHQSYVHKILTGRKERFDLLRCPGGLSGFTTRDEGPYDPFGAGHSCTALSAAIGFAEADRIAGRDNYTVAVIGDGAYTGGMVHEALNNCAPDLRLIVILNENEMSISKNTGSFAEYMAKIRSSESYVRSKQKTVEALRRIPLVGDLCFEGVKNIKQAVKNLIYDSNYFEDLGLFYLGPANGNDYPTVEQILRIARNKGECAVVHLRTCKGKGYRPAERLPQRYHSVSPKVPLSTNFSSVFGEELVRMADEDRHITAITAAMEDGTGLECFRAMHPERFFDVGIAEPHAVTFASGLAAGGIKPFFAVYSTFLQRAYDNVLHDAALQNLPVRLCIDRAALASGDGATHHGVFDVAFLSHIPNVSLYCPATFNSLRRILHLMAQEDSHPTAVRYPNAAEQPEIVRAFYPEGDENVPFEMVRADFSKSSRPQAVIVSYGNIMKEALRAERLLRRQDIRCGSLLLEQLKPYELTAQAILSLLPKSVRLVVFLEEGIYDGGAAMILTDRMKEELDRRNIIVRCHAIRDMFVKPTEVTSLLTYCQLRGEDIAKTVQDVFAEYLR